MEISDAVIVGGALVLGAYAFVFGFLRRINDWYYAAGKRHLPPGDMGWPFLGSMPAFLSAFRSNPNSFVSGLISRYGRTGMYRTYLFGCPTILVVGSDMARKVLTDDENFTLGYPKAATTLAGKKSLHGISRAEHKRIRRLITGPISGHEALSSYISLLERITVQLLDEWSSMKTPIPLLIEMRRFAFAVITNIFVSSDIDAIDLGMFENMYADLNRGMKSLAINLPGFAFHKALKAREKAKKLLQGLVERKRKRLKEGRTEKDMMDLLMEAKDEDGGQMEDEDITDLLLLFLMAGHESTAHAIMWTLIFLGQHPQYFQKAKEEQEEIAARRPSSQKGLSLREIKQMDYLSKVIDEMLRMISISLSNFRKAKAEVNINGYTIPKDWKVLVFNRGLHMDPEIYANPEEFNPSRWDNYKGGKTGAFLPFGLGTRYCPGNDLARFEIAIFLHHFLLNYRMERIDEKCSMVYLPIPRPSDNCLARIVKVE
ncbi:hypothetical protein K1719_029415 [Acacia pycnantha]|nr:hypothetical protein K1719_029237 [Acacia pycnantha]KAI9089136.1 hypothetical protein K1719_029415 [Acacia pycnantha]